ncbi:MAG: acylphosphatase [Naasia sp.]|jgi:acylphosphatase|uniref:acylphosphatase n=1 Tax=Naasia sp. TaxID=2546198 RepID=UPI002639CC11|nr:acylphosphatase [Naasia sp.]MCU1569777.1 acylphosphatase [Naasia sp.]
MTRIARRVLVSGRVQGVGFRYSCRAKAAALGVCGWVRNLEDGRVEAELEGDEAQVAALIQWLHRGPAFARVAAVEVSEIEPSGTGTFAVR